MAQRAATNKVGYDWDTNDDQDGDDKEILPKEMPIFMDNLVTQGSIDHSRHIDYTLHQAIIIIFIIAKYTGQVDEVPIIIIKDSRSHDLELILKSHSTQ